VKRRGTAGFTLIELLVVLAIGTVLTVIAIPMSINAMKSYRLMAAVSAATGAIQATRYAAIMHGYPGTGVPGYSYELTLNPANNTYQVFSMIPPATTYSATVNLGGTIYPTNPIPIARAGDVFINGTLTYQFSAGGTVTPANSSFQISLKQGVFGAGVSNTILVSGVGNVSVSTP
jgi:prepilin-type N-terminal cleavage/methylation domain-containing protein